MNKDKRIRWILSLLIIGLMAAAAEMTGKLEIIFPETAALLTGCLIMPQRPWNVAHGIFTAEITVCALAGLMISRNMIAPLYFKVLLAAAIVFFILVFSRTAMLPAISASALPVLIGTTDYIYVLAVFLLSAACDLANAFMERVSLMKTKPYVKEERKIGHWNRMLAVFAAALLLPMLTGLKFMVAPPLIVAFVALSSPESLKANQPVPTVLLFTGTALAGFFCRMLSEGTPVPETFWIILAGAAVWGLQVYMKRFFPPAAAIGILPLILPGEGLWKYPLEILAGISMLYFAAWLVTVLEKNPKQRNTVKP